MPQYTEKNMQRLIKYKQVSILDPNVSGQFQNVFFYFNFGPVCWWVREAERAREKDADEFDTFIQFAYCHTPQPTQA